MNKNYDVIIAGCGAAGLYAALNLSSDLKVLVLSKRELTLCNSSLAQGGIAGVYDNPKDSPEYHKHDTFVAGGYENDPQSTQVLVDEACIDIGRLIELGADFDKCPDGSYHRTLEGGHGMNRIFHHADTTGLEIETTLLRNVQQLANVDILENAVMCDVKKTKTGFSVLVLDENGAYSTYNGRYAIFATGGIGRVYEYTTNSAIATGDGITMADELGAEIKNLSYIQFHPTGFNNKHTRETFLISESVRGEGAFLKNCNGERFMQNYDERLELAPRDVVSHAIMAEAKKTGSDKFYLDITAQDPEFVKNRFPMINEKLLEAGYDMTKDMIPIFPCHHYLMGGINVDTYARTNIDKLYACGECSHTGVHGNNRLASNSLLEALVFSRRAAGDINEKIKGENCELEQYDFVIDENAPHIPTGIRTEIRDIMQRAYFVIPDEEALPPDLERVTELKNLLCNGHYKIDRDYVEAKSLVTVAYIVLNDAIAKLEAKKNKSEEK
ncbi:FAD-binding protein [Ruminococcus sp.]|uniref:L-aspartate oxidase n=1 Tax=Ruminococcus sp. TaxID=41978 RepID=UPI0025F008E8|nr:FAD-binding protein [Ruminococcus sp.]